MNIEITEDRARWRSTDYTWNVRIDGVLIAVAKTPGAGDRVANEVIARNDVAMLKQAISALDAVDALLTAELAHTYDDGPCCPCGRPALFFVQYPGKTYAYCPDCYRDLNAGRPPLLAQCAAIIRRCLGSTTGAGSIIDELRRVDRALNAEGW